MRDRKKSLRNDNAISFRKAVIGIKSSVTPIIVNLPAVSVRWTPDPKPETRFAGLFHSQLTTCNLELATDLLLFFFAFCLLVLKRQHHF